MASISTPSIFSLTDITFEQMYQDVKTYMTNKFQQVGDVFTPASAYGQLLSVILDMGKLMFYYIEDSVTEMNIYTASRDISIYSLARLAGHNPTRAKAASGSLLLSYSGKTIDMYGNTVIIPNYTKLTNDVTGLPYLIVYTTSSTTDIRLDLTSKSQVEVPIMQGEIEAQQLTATGLQMQSFTVTPKKGYQIDNDFVNVYVNNNLWKVYDSLYDIPYNSNGVVVKTGINTGLDIYFGNLYFGAIPPLGSTIRVEYLTTSGNYGNIFDTDAPTFTWVDNGFDSAGNTIDLNKALNNSVKLHINFGADAEPVYLTKILAPKTSRSYVLANANNYIYFLEKFNMFSVVDAVNTYTSSNVVQDSNVIYLFLIPDVNKRKSSNDNYFSIPINLFTLTDAEETKIYNLLEKSGQMVLNTVVSIVNPTLTYYVLNIQIEAYAGYNKDVIRQQIISVCSNYFLTLRRRDKIPKSEIIALIEGIDGIDSVNVWFVSQANEVFMSNPANVQSTPVGLNSFGDIIINNSELPLIRGGWSDRSGYTYHDTTDPSVPGSINIVFGDDTNLNLNMELHNWNVQNLHNSNIPTVTVSNVNNS